MWFLVAVVALAAALLEPYFIISAYRTRERVVILDETGTYHISPLLNFEDATKLHTSQTLLACIALFERNPNGYDYPDILEKMFLSDALNKAKVDPFTAAGGISGQANSPKGRDFQDRHPEDPQ